MTIPKFLNESIIINETYVNVQDKKEMEIYIDKVWDILQRTYEPIGGFKTAKTKEELIKKTDFLKMVRRKDKIVSVALYKNKKGRKAIAKGSDGTREGIDGVKAIYLEDMKMKRSWGEFSTGAEKFQLKNGAIPIPNKLVKDIIGKDIVSYNKDGFHYTRIIGGEPHEKILLGEVVK